MTTNDYFVTANRLNMREAGDVDAAIIAVLPRGTGLDRAGNEGPGERWWQVRVPTVDRPGFVAREYIAPQSAGATATPLGANEVLWTRTQAAIAAHVRYHLGSKHSRDGQIDCSGWVGEITRAAFDAANLAAAPETVFRRIAYNLFETHSDGIITGFEAHTGFILHGEQVVAGSLREGMLIGCNFGDHAWEHDNPPRVYGIDHIVQVVRDPASQTMQITQSSSSGNGVNVVPLSDWLAARKQSGMMTGNRIHVVDPFAMADRNTAFSAAAPAAPIVVQPPAPGPAAAVAAPGAALKPFSGRGAYVYTLADTIARYGSVSAAVQEMQRCGLAHVWVRIHGRGYVGDSKSGSLAAQKSFIAQIRAAGISVAGWGWCQGENIAAEIDLAKRALQEFGFRHYVADIEQDVNGAKWTKDEVTQYVNGVRGAVDGLCISSHGFLDWHDPQIFADVAGDVDCVNPQAYWSSNHASQKMLDAVHAPAGKYKVADPASYAQLCADRYRAVFKTKPVVVSGQAYAEGDFGTADAEAKLASFVQSYQHPAEVIGVNYWYWGAMSKPMRDSVAASSVP